MKTLNLTTVFLIFLFASCSTSNNDAIQEDTEGTNQSSTQIQNTAQTGTWRVTYYYDSDHEETSNYSGYSFSFNSDGSLVSVNGNTTVTGTWSVTNSSSGSSDDVHFNIFFAAPPAFEKLTDDWEIISTSSTKIELKDVSGGNGGTDFLTFMKN